MKNRNIKLILLDSSIAALTLYISFLIRFEFVIPPNFFNTLLNWSPWFVCSQICVFYFSGLYARIWRYTSLFDLYAIVKASLFSSVIIFIYVLISFGNDGYPRSVLLLYFILNTVLVIGARLAVRVYYSHFENDLFQNIKKDKKRLILIGAGKAGEKIARELLTHARNKYKLVGFIDDNLDKHGALIHGVKVFCGLKNLKNLNVYYDELLITMPSATGDQMRRIVKTCKDTGKRYRTVPSMDELIDGEMTLDKIRDVSFADLLGREEIRLDMISIEKLLNGKRILITGAGGSIGSELVNQCLLFSPSEIICLDTSEEKVYDLEQRFYNRKMKTIFKTVHASVTNKKECEKVFIENQPQIVFHAAANKHVPIQELHPWNAIETNIGGTLNILKLSDLYLVEKFVLVSTDKAVNPANVMGATKRAAEKLIQSYNKVSNTTMMAVRFGNVLGSSGSAIPTFQKQINEGGPITITHPEMTRYFMSIQEASQLILQCGAFGKDGEIFLLEMGNPIKITQMAKDLIRLSGLEPEIDIPIVYTGLRPGEKLYEELQTYDEKRIKTNHKKIMILKQDKTFLDLKIVLQQVQALLIASKNLDSDQIQSILKQMLPTYRPRDFNLSEKQSFRYGIKGEA